MLRVDLNCDMGESFGAYTIGDDERLMRAVTSANVACGFHAGDPSVMHRTVRLARRANVAVGAHPGFPDLVGFGRRDLRVTPQEVEDFVIYQIGALAAIAASEGLRLQHVKAHGALYNMAGKDRDLAGAIARAVRSVDASLIVVGLSGSEMLTGARAEGLRVASEVFADRAYDPDGSLTARRTPGSVIHDPTRVVERAIRMVRDRAVVTTDGSTVPLVADTICVHGDTPGAADLVERLRAGLERAGIAVKPIGQS
ncbi:MAG: LamB/YcsF family protein [Acidobacteria bacterium]|nr:LamB/YcsF family protein [Acidobacteriota bacterium]